MKKFCFQKSTPDVKAWIFEGIVKEKTTKYDAIIEEYQKSHNKGKMWNTSVINFIKIFSRKTVTQLCQFCREYITNNICETLLATTLSQ